MGRSSRDRDSRERSVSPARPTTLDTVPVGVLASLLVEREDDPMLRYAPVTERELEKLKSRRPRDTLSKRDAKKYRDRFYNDLSGEGAPMDNAVIPRLPSRSPSRGRRRPPFGSPGRSRSRSRGRKGGGKGGRSRSRSRGEGPRPGGFGAMEREAKEREAALPTKNTVCKDFLRGYCAYGNCKWSHVLPNMPGEQRAPPPAAPGAPPSSYRPVSDADI